MRHRPRPGWFRPLVAAIVALVGLAMAGPAVGAVVPTFTRVTQEGGTGADCTAPLPGGAGAASATYSHFAGIGTITTRWSMPTEITAGSQVTLSLEMNTSQLFSGQILLNAPAEFGGAPAPFEVAGLVGATGGTFSGSKTITFTPTRTFTAGETFVLRLGNFCNAFLYEYVATGTPDAAPAAPRLSPRTTRPVPGVVTSYAAPRPGKTAALPFPAAGCAPAATSAQVAPATSANGTCEVDIFLRRKGGGRIHDPEAVFGGGLEVSEANEAKAAKVCLVLILDRLAEFDDGVREALAVGEIATCIVAVARILQRADDLQRARRRPLGRVSDAAHRCAALTARTVGTQRARTAPVRMRCRHTAAGTRLTLLPNRKGRTIGSLIRPSSKLIVGRSDEVTYRPGDRIDVLWTITPPRTTTTIRTPTPLP